MTHFVYQVKKKSLGKEAGQARLSGRLWPNGGYFLLLVAVLALMVSVGGSGTTFAQETPELSRPAICFSLTTIDYSQIKASPSLLQLNIAELTTTTKVCIDGTDQTVSTTSETAGPAATIQTLSVDLKKPNLTEGPFRFLLIGDSFIDTYSPIGDLLKKTLASYQGVQVNRVGKVSSGLARPDFFNWNVRAQELLAQHEPNTVVIMLGANDDQSLKITTRDGQKKYLSFGSEGWKTEYSRRVAKLIRMFEEEGASVFWVGLPVVRDTSRAARYQLINEVVAQETQNFTSAYFIPTWPLLTDPKGQYLEKIPNAKGTPTATHAPDGIHLSFFGGGLVVNKIMEKFNALLDLGGGKTNNKAMSVKTNP